MLVTMTSGLIITAILVGVNPDVLQAMVTILGGTTGAAGAGYIGAQAHVDGKVRPALIEYGAEEEAEES